MIPAPASIAELAQILSGANLHKEKAGRVDLSALNRVLAHTPEDMTATVEAGITLAELQKRAGQCRQWLAIDPPHPESTMICDIINANASGPRRFGCGTIRDYLIGLTAVLADGTVIHSGGKVVKNVAGYDLMKLFIGGRGTVAVVVEATFKLRPLPELEHFVSTECKSLEAADELLESVLNSEVTPVVLDLYRLPGHPLSLSFSPTGGEAARRADAGDRLPKESTAISSRDSGSLTLILGFAGTREEVEWQLAHAHKLGFTKSASLEYEKIFWADAPTAHRLSVLPSKMIEALRSLGSVPFVARAGNGIIYHRGAAAPRDNHLPWELMRRLKDAFDPNHIFPDLPL